MASVTLEPGNFISYVPSNNIVVDNTTYYWANHVPNEDFVTFVETPHYLINVVDEVYIQAA